MPETESGSLIDTRELLWKAKRYAWIALLPMVLSVCCGFLYLQLATPVYESSVVITLGDRTQVSAALAPLVGSERAPDQLAEKIAQVRARVLNRTFLEGLCDRLGFNRDPKLLAAAAALAKKHPGVTSDEIAKRMAVAILGKRIAISPVGISYIRVGLKDPDPDVARRTANAIADALIEDTRRETLGRAVARGEFSQDQITVATEKLRQSENALRSFQESLISQRAVTGPVNEDNLSSVRELADAAEKEMDQVRSRIQTDRATWGTRSGPDQPIPDLRTPQTAELETRMSGLEASYGTAAIRRRPGEGGGEASSLLEQIGASRQQLLEFYQSAAMSSGDGLAPIQAQLASGIALDRSLLRSIQARRDRLNALVSFYLNRARSGPSETMRLDQLRNEVQTNRDLLATLQKEATSSRVSEAYETSQMSLHCEIVEPPVMPITPVWPDRTRVIAVAFLLGPLLATGVIAGMERIGAIIRTVEQAERELGAKVIGTIPRIEGWARPGSFLQNYWAPISIVGIILLTAVATGVMSAVSSGERPSAPRVGETHR